MLKISFLVYFLLSMLEMVNLILLAINEDEFRGTRRVLNEAIQNAPEYSKCLSVSSIYYMLTVNCSLN